MLFTADGGQHRDLKLSVKLLISDDMVYILKENSNKFLVVQTEQAATELEQIGMKYKGCINNIKIETGKYDFFHLKDLLKSHLADAEDTIEILERMKNNSKEVLEKL